MLTKAQPGFEKRSLPLTAGGAATATVLGMQTASTTSAAPSKAMLVKFAFNLLF
jgi:hypothetical protein